MMKKHIQDVEEGELSLAKELHELLKDIKIIDTFIQDVNIAYDGHHYIFRVPNDFSDKLELNEKEDKARFFLIYENNNGNYNTIPNLKSKLVRN